MNKLILAALLGCSFAAHAQVTAVGVHTVTTHFVPRAHGEWNNNPGVYLRTADDLLFGTLRNSDFKQSFYVATVLESPRWYGLAVDVTVGAITGYKDPVSPLLSLGVSAKVESFTVRLGYLPKPPKGGSDALHLSIEMDLP